jgi:uncharacterized protein (TIGR02284 family)
MSKVSSSLAELVELLNDGIDFYLAAAGKVSDAELSEFLQKMSYLKKAIASDLNAEIAMEGDRPREHGTWLGGMRKTYTDMLSRFSDKTARDYISELEDHEDQLLAAFRQAVLESSSARVRDLALTYFPEIEVMHAQMRQLKLTGNLPPGGPGSTTGEGPRPGGSART